MNNKKLNMAQESKGLDPFKETIKEYLDNAVENDPLFAEKYANEKKSLDDCVKYILNTVKESGRQGFADDEIFNMALHYYDEEDVKPGEMPSGNIVVNHAIELTDEEKQEARQTAKEKLIANEMARMKKKPETKKKKDVDVNLTLF